MKTDIKQSWSRIPHINKTNNLSPQTTSHLRRPLTSDNLSPQTTSHLRQLLTSDNLSPQTIERKKTMTYGMEIQILVWDRHDNVVC